MVPGRLGAQRRPVGDQVTPAVLDAGVTLAKPEKGRLMAVGTAIIDNMKKL
jgi:hypothetical protein